MIRSLKCKKVTIFLKHWTKFYDFSFLYVFIVVEVEVQFSHSGRGYIYSILRRGADVGNLRPQAILDLGKKTKVNYQSNISCYCSKYCAY